MPLPEKESRAKFYHVEWLLLGQDHLLRHGLRFAFPAPEEEVASPWVTYLRGCLGQEGTSLLVFGESLNLLS